MMHRSALFSKALLTYMATTEELVAQGALVRLVGLGQSERPWRELLALPRFITWLEADLPRLEVSWGDADPAEQLGALFGAYVDGEALLFDRQLHHLRPREHGAWELKTPDLRVFGWFVRRNCFVCCFGELADKVKKHDLYRGYVNETKRLRAGLSLASPDHVTGVEYNDVLSDAPKR